MMRFKNIQILLAIILLSSPLPSLAKNCSIPINNIHATNNIDTTCKSLTLPEISVEKGSIITIACTLRSEKEEYRKHDDSVLIVGDVTMPLSNDIQTDYTFKIDDYFDKTKSFQINATGKISATLSHLRFIFKNKSTQEQVQIACEYNL